MLTVCSMAPGRAVPWASCTGMNLNEPPSFFEASQTTLSKSARETTLPAVRASPSFRLIVLAAASPSLPWMAVMRTKAGAVLLSVPLKIPSPTTLLSLKA